MLRLLAIALLTSFSVSAEEGMRSGHATAQWLVAIQQDDLIEVVVRLQVDDGWHVYWHNPGDAGMETSVEMKMPEGWQSSGLLHPIPKKFKTGELHGFGHEGVVDYMLRLRMPKGFDGKADLQATVTWLTCNDDACIPGEITLKMKVIDGKALGPKMEADAYKLIAPKFPFQIAPIDDVKLTLQDDKNQWELTIANAPELGLDADKTEVFIETLELVPASAEVKFKRLGNFWQAKFPKSEFAPEKPEECALLLVEKGKRAVRLEWKAN